MAWRLHSNSSMDTRLETDTGQELAYDRSRNNQDSDGEASDMKDSIPKAMKQLSLKEEVTIRISYAKNRARWAKKVTCRFPNEAPLEQKYWQGNLNALETIQKLMESKR